MVPVKFEITPGETGRRTLRVEVKAPPEDNNAGDNQQEADVEIVDRKTKRAAGRQRPDARIHLLAQSTPPRQGNDRRRLSAVGAAGHLAGRQ